MRFKIVCIICLYVVSCQKATNDLQREFMPKARGEIGEIILVMDSGQYEGNLGSALRQTLRAPMKGLPQDEPLFSVNKASPKRLNSVLKAATNMIFVMTLDNKSSESNVLRGYFTEQSLKTIQRDTSIFMATRRDEFAKGQVVLYLFAKTEEQLIAKITENQNRLQDFFENIDRERIKSKLFKSTEKQIEKAIAEKHDFTIRVPFGWELSKNTQNFVWYRLLEANKEQNIFIYHEPYRSAEIFDDIARFRDKVTEMNLRDGQKPEIYITRQERDDIQGIFTNVTTFNGHYAVKARGLWKISDNSGGGPYISYTIVDEGTQKVYYIEGYVYSPGTMKKNFIRNVEAILDSFRIKQAS